MDINNPNYHQFESNKQNWSIGYWLRKHGVTGSDFDTHPCIDDMIILLNIRDSLWHSMNSSEQATWGAYWNLVFRKRLPLKEKFWRKFTSIAINIDQRQARQQQLRQQLKQFRTLENKDHNNDGKGSDLSQMLTDKGNHRGAAMSLQQ